MLNFTSEPTREEGKKDERKIKDASLSPIVSSEAEGHQHVNW